MFYTNPTPEKIPREKAKYAPLSGSLSNLNERTRADSRLLSGLVPSKCIYLAATEKQKKKFHANRGRALPRQLALQICCRALVQKVASFLDTKVKEAQKREAQAVAELAASRSKMTNDEIDALCVRFEAERVARKEKEAEIGRLQKALSKEKAEVRHGGIR